MNTKNDTLKLILISVLLILTIGGSYIYQKQDKVTVDSKKFKKEYESINGETREKDGKVIRSLKIEESNPIVYQTAEELAKKMNNKETFLVYFGFSDCPWCRSVIESLLETTKEQNINKIYYVDVKDIRDVYELDEETVPKQTKKGTKGYNQLLKKMDNVLSEYTLTTEDEDIVKVHEKRIYAPNIVAVVNGKAKKLVTGISEDEKDPYMDLTKSMKKESKEQFSSLIKLLKK